MSVVRMEWRRRLDTHATSSDLQPSHRRGDRLERGSHRRGKVDMSFGERFVHESLICLCSMQKLHRLMFSSFIVSSEDESEPRSQMITARNVHLHYHRQLPAVLKQCDLQEKRDYIAKRRPIHSLSTSSYERSPGSLRIVS